MGDILQAILVMIIHGQDSATSNGTSGTATAAVPDSPDYFQSGHMVARAEAPAASLGARAPSPPPLSTASLAAMESAASQIKVRLLYRSLCHQHKHTMGG